MPRNTNAYRRLAIYLTMDTGTLVLFRHNRATKRPACIWGDTPTPEIMKERAYTYLGKIIGLDLTDVDWINSDRVLAAVNRTH